MDYPTQLSKLIAGPIISAGAAGDTTARALTEVEQDCLAHSSDSLDHLGSWGSHESSVKAKSLS